MIMMTIMIMVRMTTTIMVTIYNQGDYTDDDNIGNDDVDYGNYGGDDYNVCSVDDDKQLRDWMFKFLFSSGGKYMNHVC